MIKIDESKKLSKFSALKLPALNKVLRIYEIKKGDKILIWTDDSKTVAPRLAKTFLNKFRKMGCEVSIIVDKEKKAMSVANKKTHEAVFSLSKGEVFVSVTSGGKGYLEKNGKRVLMRSLINSKKFKMIYCGGLRSIKPNKVNAFLRAFGHDEKGMKALNKKIAKALDKASTIKITCPAGTDLEMKINNRPVLVNDGNWKIYSTNYPVGETYTIPLENSAKGKVMVSSYKVTGKTILPKKPVEMVFEKGLLVETTGKEMAQNVNAAVDFNKKKKVKGAEEAVRTIAEFGIGTNKKASIVGSMICDEKVFGTVHIAIGSNKHMGGKTQCYGHFDNVIVKPTVFFDKKMIMKNGKLLI
ncbi:MAG: aminopeptidase [Candidatus Diapherotrites archaeon]|jgi:hypothetical protein|uniref:Aminopeptidase n=1 Tax=Candidatus Iainarchaeum sp. TaxID=3101447 RepID=A0A8T5GG85_9ARCH|nr:aminopeptidase [Candidatus Diapherotrites archaeon]